LRIERGDFLKPHLWLIKFIGVLVPRRLRADWRQEWEAELRSRETLLADWDNLNWRTRLDLLRRSLGAFRDALWLQPRRLEDEMFQDLRFGARMLLKNPGFTLIAVLTLALGIGANTAIFSVVNAVLLRSLPYPEAERFVQVRGSLTGALSVVEFQELEQQNRVFDGLFAFEATEFALSGKGQPEQLKGHFVSPQLLPLLNLKPYLGRVFSAAEYQAGQDQVALLSHRFWQRRFGAAPAVIGQAVLLDEGSYTVVGVLPPQFDFFPYSDLLLPLAFTAERQADTGNRSLGVIARLRPGIALEQAQRELSGVTRRFKPAQNARLTLLRDVLVKDFRLTLLLMWGVVGFVLLIASANFANLLLARAAQRNKELAVRAALGARRGRLVRQLLTESLLFSVLGGLVGLLCAAGGVKALLAAGPSDLPRLGEVEINAAVVAFTSVITLLTGVLFGLVPALQSAKPDLHNFLKEGAAVSASGFGFWRGQRIKSLLAVTQIALTLVLLIGAALLIKSFRQLQRLEPGYQAERLLTAQIELPAAKYPGKVLVTAFAEMLTERLRALPGVQSVATATALPLSRYGSFSSFTLEGAAESATGTADDLPFGYDPPPPPGPAGASQRPLPIIFNSNVSPEYFLTMGIPVRRGREFSPHDTAKSQPVVIINEALAQRYWPGGNPLGKRIKFGSPMAPTPWMTVVGVVGNTRHFSRDDKVRPELYRPLPQVAERQSRETDSATGNRLVDFLGVVVRTTGRPEDLASALQEQVWQLDPAQPLLRLTTMQALLDENVAPSRFNMLLFSVFAVAALLLAASGIYGVMAFLVTQRTHEIGIRMALGAQTRDVLRLVMGQGMAMALLGVVIGLGGALALTRLLNKLLFGVSATDLWTFATVVLLLLGVAAVACYLPAHRAAKVDPLVALRHD